MTRFLSRYWRASFIVIAGFVLLGGAAPVLASVSAAGPAAAREAATGVVPANATWSSPKPLPAGSSTVLAAAQPSAIDCAGTGACAAIGSVSKPGDGYGSSEAFVDSETRGAWQKPQLLAGMDALDQGDPAGINAISCANPGNCVAGGFWDPMSADFALHQGLLATEKNGKWGPAQNVPGLIAINTAEEAMVTNVSCTAPGYCTAVGWYDKGEPFGPQVSYAFTIDQTAGTWRKLHTIQPKAGTAANPVVSCVSPGNCTVGEAAAATTITGPTQAFVEREIKFRWGAMQMVPGLKTISAIACSAPGDCTAAGDNQVATSTGGAWTHGRTVGGNYLGLTSVACSSPGTCLAGGDDSTTAASNQYAFDISEKKGAWGPGGAVPGVNALSRGGTSNLSSLSCSSTGSCELGGNYQTSFSSPSSGFVVTQSLGGGQQPPPQKITAGTVGLISCFSSLSCGALVSSQSNTFTNVTSYLDVMQRAVPTATSLALSSAKAAFGHEQSEKLTVSVKAARYGPATGSVTISAGKARICAITLRSGRGTCTLSAKRLAPGVYRLVASYPGDGKFAKSVSPGRRLTVVK
jgi:hypothetical protein